MSLDLGLAGKVAIVTGGSVGIGKETARKLAAEGVSVVIAARTVKTLEAAAEDLRAQTNGTVAPIAVDTTNSQSVRALVAATAQRFGSVDILINCAAAPGGLVRNNIELADEEALLLDLNTKLVGYFRMCKYCVPHMRAGRWGRIASAGRLDSPSPERRPDVTRAGRIFWVFATTR